MFFPKRYYNGSKLSIFICNFFFHQKQYKFRVCVFIHVMEERKKMFFCNNGKWHLKEKGKRKDLENNTMEVDLVCG